MFLARSTYHRICYHPSVAHEFTAIALFQKPTKRHNYQLCLGPLSIARARVLSWLSSNGSMNSVVFFVLTGIRLSSTVSGGSLPSNLKPISFRRTAFAQTLSRFSESGIRRSTFEFGGLGHSLYIPTTDKL